ncbi:alpha-lytic protease prodomain-containing protein [Streptomyces sp. NPDC058291]|uniref:S1 family peptidase n=1 Tax=Streptomyces sp. NPDC058291 TaxID=3346427 RepID=UPI0036E649B5
MRRTGLERLCLATLLTLGGLVGAGVSPAAASGGASTPSAADSSASAAAAAAGDASPGLLRAMRQQFGLTERQASARLRAERTAAALDPRVRRTAGTAFAGSWFDPADGRLTVAVTPQASQATRAAIGSAGALVRVVEHSARTLDAAKSRLDRLPAPAGVASWHVDPAANSVVVTVLRDRRGDNDVRRFLAQARTSAPVTVETVAALPRTFAAGTVGGDPYYTGNVRCSIGFSVYGGFVTAGHCGGAGAGVRGWDGSYVGEFRGSSFPDNDYAWVSVGSGWWTVPVVLGWGTVPDQLVRGSAEAPVGSSVCRSGSTTHWHCGTVLAKNETVNYSQGAVHQMTKTSVCAEGGDSGGSFISGDQAQGVTSGGWGNCSSGGETWFQPVNEILSRYGLTLHTY